ncbi:MAG: GNAT family N-acetyltransferase [Salibacteraceae bacterium]
MIADYWKEGTDHIWLTCEWEEEPAALAYGTPEKFTEGTFNLHAVGVLKDLHRKRIGQALLAYIENLLYERGYRFLIVATSGAPAMERTRQFYLRCGYIHEATLREFWQAGEDKWIFWKKLA